MANGVELATAWVRLVPSVEGITQSVTGAVVPAMGPAGKAAGQKFSGGFAGTASPGLGKAGKDGGKSFGSGFKGAASGMMAAGLFLAAAKGVSDFVAESVKSLNRIETINAQTASAIKSTGGAANVSAAHVEKLAGKLENLTATEAESTQEGANLLLTFRNIKNGVGKGNDMFDQATASLVDMSRAMGTEPKAAAMQLGKALNDPIKGLSTLSRVGITFTDDQKAMVESMVAAGDTAGAQKVILGELNSQFGGSGAAYAGTYKGQMDLLGHSFGTLGETIMGAVMPAFQGFIEGLVPIFQWLSENQPVLIGVASAIGVVLVLALAALTAAIWSSTVAMLASPITWIVLGIMALIAAVVLLVANWDTVVAWLTEVWNGFISWITTIIDGFVAWWNEVWTNITGFLQEVWSGVSEFFAGIWEGIVGFFQGAVDWIVDMFMNWTVYGLIIQNWEAISQFFTDLWNGITTFISEAIANVKAVIDFYMTAMKLAWETVWNGISSFFKDLWNGIVLFVQLYIQTVRTTIENGINLVRSIWESVWNTIKKVFTTVWESIKNTLTTMINFIKTKPKEAFEAARDAIGKAWAGIQELAKKPVRFVVDTVINGLIDTINMIPGVNVPKVKLPKGFAGGGIIPGYDSVKRDTVLTPMRKGEGVLVPEVVRALGSGFVHSLNAAGNTGGVGAVRAQFGAGLARGGLVNPLPNGSYSVSQAWGNNGHNGIDLAAASGTKVFAAADGVVGLAGVVPMGGNEVYIQHANGLGTRYSHLSAFGTQAGATVKQGNVIGYVGSTGMSTGPHLHYMVHSPGGGAGNYGSHVNPAPYMGAFGKDLGEGGGLLDGLIDWAASKVKEKFPAGGMWVDVAAGMAKDTAKRTVDAFLPKLGADGHTKTTLYDNGGYLPPGISLVENKTRSPEPVFTGAQWNDIHDMASNGGAGSGAQLVIQGDVVGVDLDDLMTELERKKRRASALAGIGTIR